MACVQCGRELTTPAASHCPWCGEPTPSPAVPLAFLTMLRECRAKPLTVGLLVRKNLKAYGVLSLFFAAIGCAYTLVGMSMPAVAVAGVWLGVLLRDFGTFRKVAKVWPYEAAVLDWELIDRLAAGEVPPTPASVGR